MKRTIANPLLLRTGHQHRADVNFAVARRRTTRWAASGQWRYGCTIRADRRCARQAAPLARRGDH